MGDCTWSEVLELLRVRTARSSPRYQETSKSHRAFDTRGSAPPTRLAVVRVPLSDAELLSGGVFSHRWSTCGSTDCHPRGAGLSHTAVDAPTTRWSNATSPPLRHPRMHAVRHRGGRWMRLDDPWTPPRWWATPCNPQIVAASLSGAMRCGISARMREDAWWMNAMAAHGAPRGAPQGSTLT